MSDHGSDKSGTPAGPNPGSDSEGEKLFGTDSAAPTDDGGKLTERDGPNLADPDASLVQADHVQLNDTVIGEETLEPQLTTDPDTVELVEPTLAPVKISDDTADAAELEAVAAEARRVEAEAEEAGRLAGGPQPIRADAATEVAPSGTAPAGEAAGDTGKDAEAEPEAAIDAKAAAAAGANAVGSTTSIGAPEQHSGAGDAETVPAATVGETSHPERTTPGGTRPRDSNTAPETSNVKPLIWIGVAVILVLVLIAVIILTLVGNDQPLSSGGMPDAQGILAADVTPLQV